MAGTRALSDAEFHGHAAIESERVEIDNYLKYVGPRRRLQGEEINTFDELPAYCGFYFDG